MAENVQETRPPEPPPKPPEVPKPTEQSSRPEALAQPGESQQSAQQDARIAARSEHAKATNGGAPEGLPPPSGFRARLDEQSAAVDEPQALRAAPEVRQRLDAHMAAKAERNASTAHDPGAAQQPQDSRVSEATGGAATHGETPKQLSTQEAGEQGLDMGDLVQGLRTSTSKADADGAGTLSKVDPAGAATATDAGDLSRAGEGSGPWFEEGINHREGGAVQQITEGSCVSASGEMLTDGRVTQPDLLSELGDWSNLSALRDELNNRDGDGTWTGHYFADGSEALRRASEGPMAAQVQAPLGRAHMVVLEPGQNGSFTVRDPYEGSSYDVDSAWVEKYVAGGVFR